MTLSVTQVPVKESQQRSLLFNDTEPKFRYTQTDKLKNALNKAATDFRSDVVTVPTEDMMQVRTDWDTVWFFFY